RCANVEDALQAQPVRHGPRTGSLLETRRQERLDQRPQVIVHNPRPGSHTISNGRIVTPVTACQDRSTRSCYELVRDLVLGLLSDLPRKNCWSIAEWAGEASPEPAPGGAFCWLRRRTRISTWCCASSHRCSESRSPHPVASLTVSGRRSRCRS